MDALVEAVAVFGAHEDDPRRRELEAAITRTFQRMVNCFVPAALAERGELGPEQARLQQLWGEPERRESEASVADRWMWFRWRYGVTESPPELARRTGLPLAIFLELLQRAYDAAP